MITRALRLPPPGTETFFLWGQRQTGKSTSDHLKGLRQLAVDHPEVGRRVVVCLESKWRRTEDGIEIVPAKDFATMLWKGDLF